MHKRARGIAYILAILLLCMFSAMAVAFAATTNLGTVSGKSLQDAQTARLAAEGGMSYMLNQVRALRLDPKTTSATAIANIGSGLHDLLNPSGSPTHYDVQVGSTVFVPTITLDNGQFDATISQNGAGALTLTVNGYYNNVCRRLSVGLTTSAGSLNTAFNYGIASKGQISIAGNSQILGKSVASDASVISTTPGPTAVTVGGSAVISGDISTTGTPTSVVISGNPTIAGSQNPSTIAQHVHFNVTEPIFPQVDTSIFRPLATTVIDSSTDTSKKNAVFNNVIIKANTNPTFSSDVTLNGVVYIEQPNKVMFTSKVTLNGVVATDPGTSLNSCSLSFAGQVEAFGVDALPNTAQFTAVKQLSGTFIVAPGFDLSFAGQFTTINGTIAADRLSFTGQSGGTIRGSVLGLSNNPTSIAGTVDIYIDRSGSYGNVDPGFKMPVLVDSVPGSFAEKVGTGS